MHSWAPDSERASLFTQRTLRTFVSAHTFWLCISRYTGYLWVVPTCTNTGIFWRKQNLVSSLGIKNKIVGNHAFFRDIKLQFSKKKKPYIAFFYFSTFYNNCFFIISKNAWFPPIFLLDSNRPCWDLRFPHSNKLRKNISVLVGTVLITEITCRILKCKVH